MTRQTREKLERRIDGFEERQRQRNEARELQLRRERDRRLMTEHGTLRGARAYLNRKSVSFEESHESSTGHVLVTVPGQVVLVYDRNGKYVGSGPVRR